MASLRFGIGSAIVRFAHRAARGPRGRFPPALLAAGALAVVDATAAGRAWLPWSDRLLLAGALAGGFGGLGAIAMAAARRPRLAAAPLLMVVGVALGSTATAHRLLGGAAPWAGALAALALVLFAARLPALAELRNERSFRILATAVGLACLAALAIQPMRASPALRLSLATTAFLALASSAPTRSGRPLGWLCAGTLAWLAALALLRVSGNARFVAARRTQVASLLFDATAAGLRNERSLRNPPAGRAPVPDAAALADANLLVVTVDALRADRPLPTAQRGLRFSRAYAQAPHTAFSIASLLTGRDPDRLGDAPTLADLLRARRWETEAFYPAGLFFDGRRALEPYAARRFGFEWVDSRTQDARALTDAVLARLEPLRKSGEPRALFWVHYFDPHEPYEPHGLPQTATARERYDAEVRFVDGELARLIDGFRTLARPTLVVVTGDHGEEFGEHGGAYHGTSLYEEQVRVPLALFAVGAALPSHESEPAVELTDLFPTVGALLGVPLPPGDGRSLLDEKERDAHAAVSTQRMLVRGRYKLIHDLRGDLDELYDLAADPGEQHNLADARPEDLAALRGALDDWFALPDAESLIARLRNERSFRYPERAAAARALGERELPSARPALEAALSDEPAVAAEAALALATLADAAALPALTRLVDDPAYRVRAALALGRLRAPAAVPALRELTRQVDVTTRRHAIHFLGLLDGADAVPLLERLALDDLKVRGEATLALGRIAGRTHSAGAEQFVVARLDTEEYEDARAQLAWALGVAGLRNERSFRYLTRGAAAGLANAGEALVRLRATNAADFACERHDCDTCFAAVTTCRGRRFSTTVDAPGGATLAIVRGRALGERAALALTVGGAPAGTLHFTARYNDARLPIAAGKGHVTVELAGDPVELDHLLLVPSP